MKKLLFLFLLMLTINGYSQEIKEYTKTTSINSRVIRISNYPNLNTPLNEQIVNLNDNINRFYNQQRNSQECLYVGIACSVIGTLIKPSIENNKFKIGFYSCGAALSLTSFIIYLDSFKFLKQPGYTNNHKIIIL